VLKSLLLLDLDVPVVSDVVRLLRVHPGVGALLDHDGVDVAFHIFEANPMRSQRPEF
jgi:hypothetical protein